MKIIRLERLSQNERLKIIDRQNASSQKIKTAVTAIINQVKIEGDRALLRLGRHFYGLNYNSLRVDQKEVEQAYQRASKGYLIALEQMVKNIRINQTAQIIRKRKIVRPETGITIRHEWRPIDRVGLYVPGGRATYPSSLLMTALPAIIAGCQKIVICTPPKSNGEVPDATLVAARMIGVKEIYKCGGAEAIAALAFGTETIPKVDKIFGPGNAYVTEAKIQVSNFTSIDLPAGPSEVIIIADRTANPRFIAADLLADSEHGGDSVSILLTNNRLVALKTSAEIERQLNLLNPESNARTAINNNGLIIEVKNISQAIDFINDYAPEHLEIMTADPKKIVSKIRNAGSIFLGDYTAKAVGDYASGANHVLPTSSFAKSFGPLSVNDFGRFIEIQECTRTGLTKIKKTIETVSAIEKLPAHGNSVKIRFLP